MFVTPFPTSCSLQVFTREMKSHGNKNTNPLVTLPVEQRMVYIGLYAASVSGLC